MSGYSSEELVDNIKSLKKEKKAVIFGNYFQLPEIQDICDFIGDSLELTQKANETNADVIVFCGVNYMAETGKILAPDKKVLIPDLEAVCNLTESCPADEFETFIKARPKYTIISYINSSAEVKALSDIIVTSRNAVSIVNSIPYDENIIFAPDRNLGAYINNLTARNMVLWNGTCSIHDVLSNERVLALKENHPEAKLIAHPRCKPEILKIADFVGSTTALLEYTRKTKDEEFIVATDSGIIHQMKKYNPDKSFIIIPTDESAMCNECPHMKLNNLEKLYNCILNEEYEIKLSDEIINKAKVPLERMLDLSKKLSF
ncbi:MAG: quinolinate synthase NadA [Bacteroidetes bacterium]|nr:MAG: quinolinate synthase NadA [Bacteroidota bacterium]